MGEFKMCNIKTGLHTDRNDPRKREKLMIQGMMNKAQKMSLRR